MNILGIGRYQTNRLLTAEEKQNQLKQDARVDVEPHYQLSVIRMNSTFLESVDRYYGGRGYAAAGALLAVACVLGAFVFYALRSFSPELVNSMGRDYNPWQDVFELFILAALIFCFAVWGASSEIFRFTHYPIRFDRKNRLVHVFESNGETYSTPWGDLFFTLGGAPDGQWDVRGHVLAKDKNTVLKTFALSYSDLKVQGKTPGLLLRHWEFVRRYMEEGPQRVTGQVQFCMPVDGRREGFKSGAERVFAELAGAPAVVKPILYAFGYLHICARWLVMRSSKIPRWPDEIEKLCAIEPNDPYAITADDEGNRIAVYPEAAAAHGVRFVAQPSIGEGNIGVKAPKRPGDRPEVVRGKPSSKKTGKPR